MNHDEAVNMVYEYFGTPDELDRKGQRVVRRGKCPALLRRSRVQAFFGWNSEETIKAKIEQGFFTEVVLKDGSKYIPRADVVNFLTGWDTRLFSKAI